MDDITLHLIILLPLQISFQMNCEFSVPSKIVLRFQLLHILISYFALHLFACADYSYPCIWTVIHCILNVFSCVEVETLLLAIVHIHILLKCYLNQRKLKGKSV